MIQILIGGSDMEVKIFEDSEYVVLYNKDKKNEVIINHPSGEHIITMNFYKAIVLWFDTGRTNIITELLKNIVVDRELPKEVIWTAEHFNYKIEWETDNIVKFTKM